MRVHFVNPVNENLASYRYRVKVPAGRMAEAGHDVSVGNNLGGEPVDVAYFSKHYPHDIHGIQEMKNLGAHTVYDICDNHFDSFLGSHYRFMAEHADSIVCPTPAMAEVIQRECGRESTIIPDPYETAERLAWSPITPNPQVLWFGHPSNLESLNLIRYQLSKLDVSVNVVTDINSMVDTPKWPWLVQWSPEALAQSLLDANIVIIPVYPSEKSRCKSANRMIESFRAGRFVVAHPSPSHNEFGRFAWIGDIDTGINWALSNRKEAIRRVEAAQDYIRERYSPERIGGLWLETLPS